MDQPGSLNRKLLELKAHDARLYKVSTQILEAKLFKCIIAKEEDVNKMRLAAQDEP